MRNRNRLLYLSLVVAAYMVGISNFWKFPSIILKYGLSGLATYIAVATLMIPLISVAMSSMKSRRYELVDFYRREFNLLWPAVAFLLFDALVLLYYPITSGWFLERLITSKPNSPNVWSLLTVALFFTMLILVLRKGGEHTMDAMVVSLIVTLSLLALSDYILYSSVASNIGGVLSNVLEWKTMNPGMLVEIAEQVVYSVGIGMGFYLLLGGFLPENMSPVKIAIIGVALDTIAGLMATFIVITASLLAPGIEITGKSAITTTVPTALNAVGATSVLYLLYISFFFAALSSMIPLGEVITRIVMELSKRPSSPRRMRGFRKNTVSKAIGFIALVGVLAIILEGYAGFNTLNLFHETVKAFILFGTVLETLTVIHQKDYIPRALKLGSYPGIVMVGAFSTLAIWGMIKTLELLPLFLLISILGVALFPRKIWEAQLES